MTYLRKKEQAIIPITSGEVTPGEYTYLNYLRSTGTQYIDTGVKAKSSLRIVIDAFYGNNTVSRLLGSRAGAENVALLISATGDGEFYFRYNRETARPYTPISTNTRYTFDFDNNKIYLNGSLNYTFTETTFNNNVNMLLMSADYNGTIYGFYGDMFSCQMYDNGVIIRNFAPAIKNSTHEVGVHDKVNDVFYGNAGTGDFLYG